MKRIGKTDQGGILLEMTATDVQRLQQACEALGQLFDEVDGPAVVVADEAHRTFEATGTRLPDGSIKAKTIKPVATKARKYVKVAVGKQSKACEECGKHFVPSRKDSRLCSKACMDKAYRTKKTDGVKPVSVTKCLGCGRTFEPKRKDQKCCSTKCRMSLNYSKKPDIGTSDAKAPARVVINNDVKAKRLEVLRKLVKKDAYVPPEVRQSSGSNMEDISEFQQAQREARRE